MNYIDDYIEAADLDVAVAPRITLSWADINMRTPALADALLDRPDGTFNIVTP